MIGEGEEILYRDFSFYLPCGKNALIFGQNTAMSVEQTDVSSLQLGKGKKEGEGQEYTLGPQMKSMKM